MPAEMRAAEAVVLAGGLGTRLRAVVGDVPKPLAPVAGRPFLAWLLDRMSREGVRRVVLATGYMADRIEAAIGARWAGMEVAYSVEDAPLGTGGALKRALAHVSGDAVHVVNGDTYLHYSLDALAERPGATDCTMAIALAHVDDASRYGAVETSPDGRVTAFREKGGRGAGWINAGSYFLGAQALAALPQADAFSLEREFLFPQAGIGNVAGFDGTDGFIDIGVPGDYALAQRLFGATTS